MTDPVTEDFNRRCRDGDRALLCTMDEAAPRLPPRFRALHGRRLLPRPLFAGHREMRLLGDDLAALLELMVDTPRRLFGGDVAAYCDHLGIDARKAALMARFPLPPDVYARADLYHDGRGHRLLELNVMPSLGGKDNARAAEAALATDAFAAFAAEHRLEPVHTGAHIARTLRAAAAPVTGGAPPVVGFVEWNGELDDHLDFVLSLQETLADHGIAMVIGELDDVTDPGGRLRLHGRPVDLVLRYFTENEITAHPRGEELVEPLFRAHEEGRTLLWTTFASAPFNNKAALGLVADPRMRATMTDTERRLVDRILPWTRRLTPDLIDHCITHRTDLILKPSFGFGGKGITAGWHTPPHAWKETLTRATDHPHIVQRRITPRPEPVIDPDTGTTHDWHASYGVFLMPQGYAGTYVRAVPADSTVAVTNLGTEADTRVTTLLHRQDP